METNDSTNRKGLETLARIVLRLEDKEMVLREYIEQKLNDRLTIPLPKVNDYNHTLSAINDLWEIVQNDKHFREYSDKTQTDFGDLLGNLC
jgi:hypothetical protein